MRENSARDANGKKVLIKIEKDQFLPPFCSCGPDLRLAPSRIEAFSTNGPTDQQRGDRPEGGGSRCGQGVEVLPPENAFRRFVHLYGERGVTCSQSRVLCR